MSEASPKKSQKGKPKLRAIDPNDPELGWQAGFLVDQYGKPKACARTVGLIVRNWAPFEGLRLNELTLEIEQGGAVIPEVQYFRWREQMEAAFRVPIPPEILQDAVATAAAENAYHPIRDYLDGLQWDEVHRLQEVPPQILDCHDPLARRYVTCWLTSAVARVYEPGCQADSCLTLYSAEQGRKKTSYYRELFPPGTWAIGDADPARTDTLLAAHQHWCMILDEVDELTKAANWPAVKRSMTNPEDTFRAPYDRRPARRKRRFIFGATTNEKEFLNDPSGSRRWWIVDVGPADPERRMEKLREWRDQLFAEAKYRYQQYVEAKKAGKADEERRFRWWLSPDEEQRRELDAERHHRRGIADEQVETYVARQAPGAELRIAEVMEVACKIPVDRIAKESALARQIGRILKKLGFEPRERETNGVRCRVWKRPDQLPLPQDP